MLLDTKNFIYSIKVLSTLILLVMCDKSRYTIFLFNIVIQYWLLCVLIHQISKPDFYNLPNFIPKSNYNKLVCITLIDFFYYLLTTKTKQDIYLHYNKHFNYFKYHDTVSYRDIFGSDMQYNRTHAQDQ